MNYLLLALLLLYPTIFLITVHYVIQGEVRSLLRFTARSSAARNITGCEVVTRMRLEGSKYCTYIHNFI